MDSVSSSALGRAFAPSALTHGECARGGAPAPCSLVIFGASGDLTARKLFPALFRLLRGGLLDPRSTVVGVARSGMDDDMFRRRMKQALQDADIFEEDLWEQCAQNLHYHQLHYDSPKEYAALAKRLGQWEAERGDGGNRLFYLATPPTVYGTIAEHLGRSGLARETEEAYARLVVEKPFGHDLPSARALDATLHEAFAEHQIFRIDHYLAKETVQNILLFRFGNAVFEPIWNRRYIASITCASSEKIGVEHRAGYYEHAGVLRDMFQNHMMQILSLVAIEPPALFEADRVRDEKVKVYRALRPFAPERLREHLVLGQYARGVVDGREVPAYREERGVSTSSITPTFAMLTAYVDNWRWQGVPFHIMSGKRLQEKLTRIVITFRDVPHSMFRDVAQGDMAPNRLVVDVAPDNAISLQFQAKVPGAQLCFRPVTMRYDFSAEASGTGLDAYEKVVLDCMLGDQMLFWRQDGVEACWGYLTPILDLCEACGDAEEHLHPYPAGSWGPQASLKTVRTLF